MYLLKFAYDGTQFQGYSRQDGKNTVEGEILKTLNSHGVEARLKSSSRTDRGVSALGNVVGIVAEIKIDKLIGILTNSRNIYFYAYTIVDDSFNPRHASERWYRYVLPYKDQDIVSLAEKSKWFIGEHDFSLFSRKDGRKTVRRIKSIEVLREGDLLFIDVRGENFLWNMVRRIVGFILYGNGNPYITGGKFNVPAEGLILMDVSYDLKFKYTGIKKRVWKDIYQEMAARYLFYRWLDLIKEGRWGIEPQ